MQQWKVRCVKKSCREDAQLLQNMTDAGLNIEIIKVDNGPHHIYVGTKS